MNISTQKYSQDLRRYYRLPSVQVSLTLVLSLFVMAFFITFALRPTITSITTLNKTISESEKTLDQLEAKVNALQIASKQLEAIKPSLPVINAGIPNNNAQHIPLTLDVESLAAQTGVQIESENLGSTMLFSRILSPFTPNKKQGVVLLPFSLRVVGDYNAINDFLSRFLKMQRIVSTDSITITKEAGSKATTAGVVLNISGNAYYLADEEQLKKAIPEGKGRK